MSDAVHLQVAETVDAAEWDGAVVRLDGTIFHSSVWAKYLQTQYPNIRPCFLRLQSDEDGLVGLALMFAERSPRKLLGSLTGTLRSEATPLVAAEHGDAATFFAKAIEDFARSQSLPAIRVGSFGGNAGMAAFTQLGYQPTCYWEFVLDLSLSEDELWERMDRERRNKIRKAGRARVFLEDHNNEEGMAELRRLQGASSLRIVARGGPDITPRFRHADPVQVLLDSGVARIVCARLDGRVVSAGLFTCFNNTVYYALSGHTEEALKTQAPTFLLWETIKRYKAEGARRFNLGGCSVTAAAEDHPEHGVYVYKRDFGGDRSDCVTFHKILSPLRHRLGAVLQSVGRRGLRKTRSHGDG